MRGLILAWLLAIGWILMGQDQPAAEKPDLTIQQRLELQKRYVRVLADRLAADRAAAQAQSSQRALTEQIEGLRAICVAAGKDLLEAQDGDVSCVVKSEKARGSR